LQKAITHQPAIVTLRMLSGPRATSLRIISQGAERAGQIWWVVVESEHCSASGCCLLNLRHAIVIMTQQFAPSQRQVGAGLSRARQVDHLFCAFLLFELRILFRNARYSESGSHFLQPRLRKVCSRAARAWYHLYK
jgi:hypothetical protein